MRMHFRQLSFRGDREGQNEEKRGKGVCFRVTPGAIYQLGAMAYGCSSGARAPRTVKADGSTA